MISRSAVALLMLSISPSPDVIRSGITFVAAAAATADDQQSEASWHKFGTNVNYRITAYLDVNGGADEGPNFESFTNNGGGDNAASAGERLRDDAATKSKTTPGYSVPIDVLTLQDSDGTYRQRVSYYSGMQVDYNMNGEGYKVISTPFPFSGKPQDDEAAKQERTPSRR